MTSEEKLNEVCTPYDEMFDLLVNKVSEVKEILNKDTMPDEIRTEIEDRLAYFTRQLESYQNLKQRFIAKEIQKSRLHAENNK